MSHNVIRLRGARQNNLKNLDLALPLGELIVITGSSGSGKSSLAFDTVFAEGQRRYVETFSPYARQFLDRMDKPAVDAIEGIPPAIAIDQTNPVRSSRSTVDDDRRPTGHWRYSEGPHCPDCNRDYTDPIPNSFSFNSPRSLVSPDRCRQTVFRNCCRLRHLPISLDGVCNSPACRLAAHRLCRRQLGRPSLAAFSNVTSTWARHLLPTARNARNPETR